jgi:hypothetical protein
MATTGEQVAFDCLKSNNQDPNDWFNAFEKYAASWNWDHNIMARKVPVYFKGEADYHWSQLSSEERADYDFVKYYMIRKLTPENKGNDALKEYIGYIQSTESYEEVARKIRKLAARTGLVMKEENLIQKFVEAIKPELMIAIASARPRTLDAAVYEAKRLDSIAQLQASRSRLEYEINSTSTNKQERQ